MIILGLSDIHGDITKLDQVREPLSQADLVLLVGDITNFGKEKEATHILGIIMEQTSRILAVSGNCDFPEVDSVLEQKGISIHKSGTIINDIGFIGVGGSLPAPFKTPNEMSEDDFKEGLENAVSDFPKDIPIILISHHPPINTICDRIGNGAHVGSNAVRQFIEDYQPLICFTGHIHEAEGIDHIGKTKIINPGKFRNRAYAFANVTEEKENPVEELLIRRF